MPATVAAMVLAGALYLIYVMCSSFPTDIDAQCLVSAKENACTLFGAVLGMTIVYIVDEKWLNFSVKAIWQAQTLKVILGLIIILALKAGLKEPLNFLFGEYAGRALRYFLIVFVAGIVWPLSFRWFSKLGNKVDGWKFWQ